MSFSSQSKESKRTVPNDFLKESKGTVPNDFFCVIIFVK